MKILFIGVFTEGSTNISQKECLIRLGHDVDEFSYRSIFNFNIVLQEVKNYDIILIAKGNGISQYTMNKLKENNGKIILWWPDPTSTLKVHPTIIQISEIVDCICACARNTLPIFKKKNKNSYYIAEGYDEVIDKPYDVEKDLDISFIGSLHNLQRKKALSEIKYPVNHITNAYGIEHAKVVSRSKICLNFSTTGGASDRVFKTLAAKGFLLSSDWEGREHDFVDGEHLVIFNDIDDLNKKIKFYLENEEARNKLRNKGYEKVQEYTRKIWAEKIMEMSNK